jgi:hypothetical protein
MNIQRRFFLALFVILSTAPADAQVHTLSGVAATATSPAPLNSPGNVIGNIGGQSLPRTDGQARTQGSNAAPNPDTAMILNLSNIVDHLIQSERNTDEKFANLIQIMIWCALILTACVGIGLAWVVPMLRDFMKEWARQQLTEQLKESFRETQIMVTAANAEFSSALDSYSSQQFQNKLDQLEQEIPGGRRAGLDIIMRAVVDLTVQPMRLRDDILGIAYRQEPTRRQIQRIYSLWAEVKAEEIDARTARRLVQTLIRLVTEKPDSMPVVRALKMFDTQLSTVVAQRASLPAEPGF